jgi:hypothetical protein
LAQLAHQGGQLEQVFGTEVRPPGGQDEERVGVIDVGPRRRQRTNASLSWLSEEDPVLAPSVGEPDQFEVAPGQRVERVGDTESLRIVAARCS